MADSHEPTELYWRMHEVVQRARTMEDIALLDRQLDKFAEAALQKSIKLLGDPTEVSQDSSEDEQA